MMTLQFDFSPHFATLDIMPKHSIAKPSIRNFKPHFKTLGFTAPRWQAVSVHLKSFHSAVKTAFFGNRSPKSPKMS